MRTFGALLAPGDTAAVVSSDIKTGDRVSIPGFGLVTAAEKIPVGHKIALKDIFRGESVIKYGLSIGKAKSPILKGSWIHSHNLETGLATGGDYAEPATYEWTTGKALKDLIAAEPDRYPAHFMGYPREKGRAGIRNELWILPMVGCVNKTAEAIAQKAAAEFGVPCHAFTHPFGCSQLGDDLASTQTILARLATHPNAGGVLLLALGCENNTLSDMKSLLANADQSRLRYLHMQDSTDEFADAHRLLGELAERMKKEKREPVPISELAIGMKCGGSDAFSGITANPLAGYISDLITALGGSAILTEVPEMFGAESELMSRCVSPEVGKDLAGMIQAFKDYFVSHGQEVYENPSPGNRDGGITTLEEKSLGCVRKAGTAPVEAVLPYGSRATGNGLTLVSGPGNDLVSTTALTAAGAQIILFTTGRGTPFGAPVPTIKIASNSSLATRKPGWIDFNAGQILEGLDFGQTRDNLFSLIVRVASGAETRNETNGNREIAIFKDSVIL